MALADFRYVMRFCVPFSDVDMMEHVNHASYLVWAETIRCGYFVDVLGEKKLNGVNGSILGRLEFAYEQQLDYREDVAIGCRIARMGRKSFDFAYEIWSETRQRRAAHGTTSLIAYDYEARQSKPIPEQWREIISRYEAVPPVIG